MAPMDLVTGPTIVGTMFNIFLFGCAVVQYYTYFNTFKTERRAIRGMVCVLLLLDSLNAAFGITTTYGATITAFGDVAAATATNWKTGIGPVLMAFIAGTVQSFFAWRVYCMTRSKWLFGGIIALIIISAASACITGIAGTIVEPKGGWYTWGLEAPIVVWLVTAVIVDCVITGTLCLYLRGSRTGFAQTDLLITRLIRLTVQTGLITAIWTIIDLILYLAMPQPVHLIFNLPLSNLYTNSLLSTLNARLSISDTSSRSGPVITDTDWKDRAREGQGIVSGIHISTVATVHHDEFELTPQTKKETPHPTDDSTSGKGDLEVEASPQKHGQYSLTWK
ncbi:hypothetical protein NEOLEDRAFT_1141559 [Neolentinus lepideus HHB14362 ss-1]|uniref:DUF6534 domain-containing protein n=1 Tax=Neolentinus lepideus HHB14362 ss-1 TaxID=1314782 RepID=A0A165NLB4_9AGAM|nr:hypothetical protein NEOLEDRAFT_1141559 [Neolentinus lepideus HHB14362 ss-1]